MEKVNNYLLNNYTDDDYPKLFDIGLIRGLLRGETKDPQKRIKLVVSIASKYGINIDNEKKATSKTQSNS